MTRILTLFALCASVAFAQSSGGIAINSISRGGTGATTASQARTNLGVSSGYSVVAATVAALKATTVSGLADGTVIYVLGYAAAGDGGGGMFRYDLASAVTPDNGTIVSPNSGSGRWKRHIAGSINVKWFGAKGDQTTDDTAAIQAAVNVAVANNAAVYFPKSTGPDGLYLITSTISVSGRCRIFGDGMNISGIFCSECDGLSVSGGTSFVTIENLAIYRTVLNANSKTGILASGTSGSRCDNITIRNVWIDGFNYGVSLDWASALRMENVKCNRVYNGFHATGGGVNNFISACHFVGKQVSGGNGIYIDGTGAAPEAYLIRDCLVYGFDVGLSSFNCTHSVLAECVLDYCTVFGVVLNGASFNWTIRGNYIASSGSAGDTGIYCVNGTNSAQVKGDVIEGNTITAYGTNKFSCGIRVSGAYEKQDRIIANVVNCNASIADCRLDTGSGHVVIGNEWMGIGFDTDLLYPVYDGNKGAIVNGLYSVRRTHGADSSEYFGEAAPTTGTWGRQDIVWNSTPTAGGAVGWVCVVAGSPGTWKAFGSISP